MPLLFKPFRLGLLSSWAASLLATSPVAASCFCRPVPPAAYLDSRNVVFAGTYLGAYEDAALYDVWGALPAVHQFRVERCWRGLGHAAVRVSLTYLRECGPRPGSLRPGTAYLVYLGAQPNLPGRGNSSMELPLLTLCDSIVPLTQAQANVAALDAAYGSGTVPHEMRDANGTLLLPRPATAHPAPPAPDRRWQVAALLSAGANLGLLVWLWARRR